MDDSNRLFTLGDPNCFTNNQNIGRMELTNNSEPKRSLDSVNANSSNEVTPSTQIQFGEKSKQQMANHKAKSKKYIYIYI